MSDGRTVWWSKDAAWWERERVVMLGEEFGAAGPAVADWITCQAKKQNDGGRLRAGFRTVARGAFVDSDTARAVIGRAVELGFLDDFRDEGITFGCRVSGWSTDQEMAGAAVRQRRYRERLKEDGIEAGGTGPLRSRVFERDGHRCLRCNATRDLVVDHVVPRSKGGNSAMENLQTLCDSCNKDKGTSSDDYRNVTSRVTPVTECPPTEQDRTEDTSSLRSEVTRKRATRRVDQSKLPDEFPAEHESTVAVVLPILHRCWDARGGVEPGRRGVGLAVLRNPRADHEQVARKLEHWLLAGKGQHARCADVASRFGDWVADESAALRVIDGGQERAPALQRADAWRNAPEYQRGEAS